MHDRKRTEMGRPLQCGVKYFRRRVVLRLRERGWNNREIADVWGISRQAIYRLAGRTGERRLGREAVIAARIVHRLREWPHKIPAKTIARLLDISPDHVYKLSYLGRDYHQGQGNVDEKEKH